MDFTSSTYVPPNQDSKLDKKTGTFKAEKIGNINNATGDYIPPQGIRIDDKKGFVIDKQESEKMASNEDKEKLKSTLASLNNNFEKQVKVNKIQSPAKSKLLSWLPKNHLISFEVKPYSEILTVKNKESNSEAEFFTESARWTILSLVQEWNDKWSSRIRIGGQEYEIDESDVQVYKFNNDNGNEDGYFSIGAGYKHSDKITYWIELVDRSEYYVAPSQGNGVEIRSQSLTSLDFSLEYKLKRWKSFDVSTFGTFHFIGSEQVPGAYGGEESADFFAFSLGSELFYSFNKKLGLETSAWYSRMNADADSMEYTRNTFGLGLNFIYDI